MTIDLNCDLGEGAGHDAELMPWITSANIACGAHAGDDATMRETLALARVHGVAVGAHPGFNDAAHFGRRELTITPHAAGELVVTQVRRLQALAAEQAMPVGHVKLHGALYNLVARDRTLAAAVVAAVRGLDETLVLVVPAGSEMERVARAVPGLPVVAEVFADRTYQADGSLTPRTQPGSVITEEALAVTQVLRMVRDGLVRAADGTEVRIRADTVCLHGDGVHAVEFARRLRKELAAAGVAVKAFRA